MLALKSNKKRLLALLLAAVLLVPTWPAARAETVIDPPTQGEPGVPPIEGDPVIPPIEVDPVIPPIEVDPVIPPTQEGEDNGLPVAIADIALTAGQIDPPKATPGELPIVTVEGNLVKDDFGTLTGIWELSLLVKTPVGQAFQSVGACLWYDATYLTPLDASGNPATQAVPGTNYSTALPTIKGDAVSTAGALFGGDKGYLYLEAEALSPPELPAGARTVTVRFKVDKNISFDDAAKKFLYTNPTTSVAEAVKLFDFVDETTDVDCFASRIGQALWYESAADNSFYYVPGYDGATTVKVSETVPLDNSSYDFDAPPTVGMRVRAADPAELTPASYYSYLSNHLTTGTNVLMAQVSDLSAGGSKGIELVDVATVVFFDWDDSFLGATAVVKNVDNRMAINDFVEKNMVHPKLQKSASLTLDRKDTYRGEYPCIAPGNGDTFPDDHATAPGKNYPLTNKLDYAFYGRTKDPDYAYISGWTPVTPATMEDTWTALETGATPTIADFSAISDSVAYVKALYEPGEKLNYGPSGDFFTISDKESYSRYGNATSYVIRFEYNRINNDEYGVTRPKEPAIQMIMRFENSNVYMKVDVKNKDKITVELTPAKEVMGVDYLLVDAKGASIVAAASKSDQSGLGTFENYDSSGAQGTLGFVRSGTVAWFVEQIYENATAGAASEWAFATYVAMNDCGFKRTTAGAAFAATPPANLNNAKTRLQKAMIEAITNGASTNLTWHQLQYAILQSSAPFFLPADQAKVWCIQNCTFLSYYDAGYINGVTPDPAPDIP